MHRAYKAHIISTIVDAKPLLASSCRLQGSYNFYYCRYEFLASAVEAAYKAHIISTIVDINKVIQKPMPTRLI